MDKQATHKVTIKGVNKFEGTVGQCLDFFDSVGGTSEWVRIIKL